MKITLAYPYEGKSPDETIDVDDDVGRTLVRDGLARLPDGTDNTDNYNPVSTLPTPSTPATATTTKTEGARRGR